MTLILQLAANSAKEPIHTSMPFLVFPLAIPNMVGDMVVSVKEKVCIDYLITVSLSVVFTTSPNYTWIFYKTFFNYLPAVYSHCTDTESWDDDFGEDCSYYVTMCREGAVLPGNENHMGSMYNYPENNCCICGKDSSGTQIIGRLI